MHHHRLFDDNSDLYARSRPSYPKEVYEMVQALCSEHVRAWDIATGNGQAAIGLAEYFDEVQATDISSNQIENAFPHPRIHYTVQPAEDSGFLDNTFDLVTVAQALHWFDYDLFWPEVQRVLKPSGLFAAWSYNWLTISPQIDSVIETHLLKDLETFWAPQNKLMWDGYQEIPFPLQRLEPPQLNLNLDWNLDELFSYLHSWSATRRCIEQKGDGFFRRAYAEVEKEWGSPGRTKVVSMPLMMILGRNSR